MRLRSQQALLALIFAVVACTEPSEPASISAQFILTEIDGQSLPVGSPPSVGSTGPTIVSGTMVLNGSGIAAVTEDRVEPDGTHLTITIHYTYSINGSEIKFAYVVPCGSNANCVALPTGQLLDNGLRAQLTFPPGFPFQVYNYRISATL
jgi:hypothetical protein